MSKGRFGYPAGGVWVASIVATLGMALVSTASPARADLFTLTSCGITGGCGAATSFGTVTLTQSGTSVQFDVVLSQGNRFVETGAGGGGLFLFNDSLIGSAITSITATLNGATVSIPGGLLGFTNISPPVMASSSGTFSASVECTDPSVCNGGSTPNINDLHFVVTNATLAQLETANPAGNIFVADILNGSPGGSGLTGPVAVSAVPVSAAPEPATLFLVGTGLAGAVFSRRRHTGRKVRGRAGPRTICS